MNEEEWRVQYGSERSLLLTAMEGVAVIEGARMHAAATDGRKMQSAVLGPLA